VSLIAKLMTVEEISDMLQVSQRTVLRLADKEDFPPSIRVGRARRWSTDSVREWLRRNTRDYFHGDYCTLVTRYGAVAVPIIQATHRVSTADGTFARFTLPSGRESEAVWGTQVLHNVPDEAPLILLNCEDTECITEVRE
jgi:excisionase family DNA binding protein